eukprot:gnl/TRDRNA2_/TRDRNA2_43698_c0_seq1.p1 gnl/TRDRNA2_/TRDRNA2_43698_c0~~gnl/TRDRNA2_/TRDRNA2_43698_c0_seq1.p1  ORF type:complete len:333 (-),score=67.17 gnl/TRDRNA2_/TRDRNA2_43698_c0_seq1:87-1034(-)
MAEQHRSRPRFRSLMIYCLWVWVFTIFNAGAVGNSDTQESCENLDTENLDRDLTGLLRIATYASSDDSFLDKDAQQSSSMPQEAARTAEQYIQDFQSQLAALGDRLSNPLQWFKYQAEITKVLKMPDLFARVKAFEERMKKDPNLQALGQFVEKQLKYFRDRGLDPTKLKPEDLQTSSLLEFQNTVTQLLKDKASSSALGADDGLQAQNSTGSSKIAQNATASRPAKFVVQHRERRQPVMEAIFSPVTNTPSTMAVQMAWKSFLIIVMHIAGTTTWAASLLAAPLNAISGTSFTIWMACWLINIYFLCGKNCIFV